MLTPSTPVATPFSPEQTNTAKAATVEANARLSQQAQAKAGDANESRVADIAAAQATAQQAASEIPDPMASLSTVAVAGAMSSLPVALNMMQKIVLASASGTLTDADRQTLQSDYAQLTAKVVSSVGSVGAGEQAQTSTAHDGERDDDARDARREQGGKPPAAVPQAMEVPKQVVPQQPVESTVTIEKAAPVAGSQGTTAAGPVEVRAHELHVGANSYEPVPVRHSPSLSSTAVPQAPDRQETPAETRHASAAHAGQVAEFVHVAQPEPAAPLVAVA